MTAAQMDRIKGLRAENGGSNIAIMDLPVKDLRTKQIKQLEPGGDSTVGEPESYSSTDNNPYLSEFNIMADLGEKV